MERNKDDEISDNIATCWEIALSAAGKLVLNYRRIVVGERVTLATLLSAV